MAIPIKNCTILFSGEIENSTWCNMEEQTLNCVYCGEPIWVGAPFENVFNGKMHPECAHAFEEEWESHREFVRMNEGVDRENYPD